MESDGTCFLTMLMLATLGFVMGLVTWGSAAGTRLSTVMAARYYASKSDDPTSLPRLPRAVFVSFLFLLVGSIKYRCPEFQSRTVFIIFLVVASFSTGLWLNSAMVLQNAADEQRKKRIAQFIESEPGSEPLPLAHIDVFPSWLRIWEAANLMTYAFIVAAILFQLFRIRSSYL